MKKIILYGNAKDLALIKATSFRFDFISNDESYIVYKVTKIEDFKIINKLKQILNIKIILLVKCQEDNVQLSAIETNLLLAMIKEDLVKVICIDNNISRTTYYNILKKMLQKTNLESVEALRYWAILHLSV